MVISGIWKSYFAQPNSSLMVYHGDEGCNYRNYAENFGMLLPSFIVNLDPQEIIRENGNELFVCLFKVYRP